MFRKIALITAATLFSAALATAQTNSAPSSTAGGAQGTTKQGVQDKAPKGTTGASTKERNSSPDSTAGGAQGTTKRTGNVPGSR